MISPIGGRQSHEHSAIAGGVCGDPRCVEFREYAGPCSHEIDRVQREIDAKLEAKAAAGPSARESTAATTHRQPTPGSIAAAETRLGEVSPQRMEAVVATMARAREVDGAGDKSACEQALADVRRALGP